MTQIMNPRTDLCDTCQHFLNGLHYNAHKGEEVKDLLKKYKDHLAKTKLERNYYNKNTKFAIEIEQRKLIDQNYLLTKDNTKYCSIMLLLIIMIELKMFIYHILI